MAENWEKINAVQRMQEYMMAHYQEKVTLEDLAKAARYSPWHSLRAFSELIGKTPLEYLRQVRLTAAAKRLRDTDASVLEIALDSAFTSHEGFTKAFSREFSLSPQKYRKKTPPIKLHSYYPIRHYYQSLERGEDLMPSTVVFTSIMKKPERKLILKRGVKAADYFAYCEEVGCDIWGILASIKGALGEPMGLWLPKKMRTAGTSEYCQGVEMPMDFSGEIPEGFDLIVLPACQYMLFHGEPFEDDQFDEAIRWVWEAIDQYRPEMYGWEWAPEEGPRFQLEPIGKRGYMEGLPVRECKEKEKSKDL